MSKFYVPTNGSEDWKALLARPDEQWKPGHSAKALAYCWEEANGFPPDVRTVFRKSGEELFQDIRFLLAFPEYKVPLPGGLTCAQNDIFVLAKSKDQLVSIAVEGKVSEPFDKPISEWKSEYGRGKQTRLRYLCGLLRLDMKGIDHIYYQLLHRTASAVIEAERFKAENALMLVHSFSKENKWFNEYCQFLALFGVEGKLDALVTAGDIQGISLYFAWVKGNKKYLER